MKTSRMPLLVQISRQILSVGALLYFTEEIVLGNGSFSSAQVFSIPLAKCE